jgi:elongation factor G
MEAACVAGKSLSKKGSVDNATSNFDVRPDEKERKSSVTLNVGYCEYNDAKINLLDCPGFLDFKGEVYSALRAVEAAAFVIDASEGVEVGTEVMHRIVKGAGVAKMVLVNGIDKEGADFDKMLEGLKNSFGTSVAPITIPLGNGADVRGVVDIVTQKAYTYDGKSMNGKAGDIPEDMMEKVQSLREALMEAVAESDEALMEKYFEAGELSDEEIEKGLAEGVTQGLVVPVMSMSALNDIGIDQVLATIVALSPSAASRSEIEVNKGEERTSVAINESDHTAAFVFKTISEEHLGEITVVRVYNGAIETQQEYRNVSRDHTIRSGTPCVLVGHTRHDTEKISAGDIGAMIKLKDTHTSDTIGSKDVDYTFDPVAFPEPLTYTAIECKEQGDDEKISEGIAKLNLEDPSFTYAYHSDIHQSILSGMGEQHITTILNNLQRRFKVHIERVQPKISYRETITKPVKYVEYTHKKQSGGAGQFGRVYIDVEPMERGGGYEFLDKITGGVIDQQFRPSVDKGIKEKMKEGIIAGYPVIDIRVSLVDGKTHPVDSKDIAFQIAGREAFVKAFEQAGPVLLEPITEIKITAPDEFTGDVMGSLSSLRGKVQGMDPDGNYQVITAKVPEAEVINYAQSLKSMTQGRGTFTKRFSHYEPVPHEVAQKIIDASKS